MRQYREADKLALEPWQREHMSKLEHDTDAVKLGYTGTTAGEPSVDQPLAPNVEYDVIGAKRTNDGAWQLTECLRGAITSGSKYPQTHAPNKRQEFDKPKEDEDSGYTKTKPHLAVSLITSRKARQSQIIASLLLLFKKWQQATSGFEMCFGPSTLGGRAKTRLECRIKKFTPHCICK